MDVPQAAGTGEERGDLTGIEAGDAAADAGDQESEFRMPVGEDGEFVDLPGDLLQRQIHRRDSIALPLQAPSLTIVGPKTIASQASCTAVMMTGFVAAKDEDLTFAKG